MSAQAHSCRTASLPGVGAGEERARHVAGVACLPLAKNSPLSQIKKKKRENVNKKLTCAQTGNTAAVTTRQ